MSGGALDLLRELGDGHRRGQAHEQVDVILHPAIWPAPRRAIRGARRSRCGARPARPHPQAGAGDPRSPHEMDEHSVVRPAHVLVLPVISAGEASGRGGRRMNSRLT
jgi:hypothetical protein